MKRSNLFGILVAWMAFTPFVLGCGSASTDTTGAPAQSELQRYLDENPDENDESIVELNE